MLDPPVLLPVAGPEGSVPYQMTPLARELADKFQTRTILTVGSAANCIVYQTQTLRIAVAVSSFHEYTLLWSRY